MSRKSISGHYLSPHGPAPLLHRSFLSPPHYGTSPRKAIDPNRSLNVSSRTLLSPKVPMSFYPGETTIHTIPTKSLQFENKLTLYSEIERLTILNLELKKENEALSAQIEDNGHMIARIADQETIISELQQHLSARDDVLEHTRREHEQMAVENLNLSKLEPAYNEVLEHNKSLIREIERLDAELKEIQHERDELKGAVSTLELLDAKLEASEKRVHALTQEKMQREEEIRRDKLEMDEMNRHISDLMLEIQESSNSCNLYVKEIAALKTRIKEHDSFHEARVNQVKEQIESEVKAFMELEKAEAAGRHLIELRKKDEELAKAKKLISDLEDRLIIMGNEMDHLHKRNFDKIKESDDLRMKISHTELEKIEVKKQLELEFQLKLDEQAKEYSRQQAKQESQYEMTIAQLRTDLNEIHKMKSIVRQKEAEIEALKAQLVQEAIYWERKMNQAIETEVKTVTNKFTLEKNNLEAELTATKEQNSHLEKHIALLTVKAFKDYLNSQRKS